MKRIKLFEDFINEATTSWKKMMQGVRSSETGPWSIVAIQDRKVVGQSIDIRIQDLIPAKYEALKKEFPKAKLHIEDGTGMVVWNESIVTEGQFSWMTQDTGKQIGSEKENTIAVTMFDDKGNKWLERKYDGYGEFGGKDYYELLAQMNGVENADRQDGIDIAFGKMKIKGDILFPALIENPARFNFKRHDFTQEPENDPNQSWYQEPEYDDDDDDNYDDSNESVVYEAKSYDADDIFFLWDEFVDNGREGIERGHVGSGSSKHELFTFDTGVDGYDKFETELKKLLKKSGWKNEYSQDTLKVYESKVNEAMFKAKDYDKILITYAVDTRADEIYVIKVAKVILSGFPDVSKVPDKRFHDMFGMMLEENWMKQYDKLPEPGDILPAPKKDKAFEAKVNEAKDLSREEMMDFMQTKYKIKFVRTSEEFDGETGGIWIAGDNEESLSGGTIFSYYNSSSKYKGGVLKNVVDAADKRGWYFQWSDPGTMMMYPKN